jgi:hypothetical protein
MRGLLKQTFATLFCVSQKRANTLRLEISARLLSLKNTLLRLLADLGLKFYQAVGFRNGFQSSKRPRE